MKMNMFTPPPPRASGLDFSADLSDNICPVCSGPMYPLFGAGKPYAMCKVCRYMAADSMPGAGAEIESLGVVREKNFTRIIKTLKKKYTWANTILDVGSSHGVFLRLAAQNEFTATGLEPDERLAGECRNSGFDVVTGFFPEADELAGKTFDIIIFNDSFEHIPNLQALITGIKAHLGKKGIVVVNLPNSDGLLFQSALLAYQFGIQVPFDRLWQKGFASPHLHYFNTRNLKMLFERHGFTQQENMPLSYYLITGLWRRIRCKASLCVSIIAWLILTILYPFFCVKSDCFASYFTFKNEACYE
ncbi:MAG: class I SAM-dependent methyltransferase [Spirochaetaceae bacterium]|jgi:2-polyprenyl-3-methyl-5-hydroxy-6-metoxy-1,4-benzoquinol methylase|nr:class I SAM-dependent methyltransferase [Spirochaetaceae bacterium]